MNKVLGSVQLNQLDIFQQAFKRALDSHRPLAHLREDLEPLLTTRCPGCRGYGCYTILMRKYL